MKRIYLTRDEINDLVSRGPKACYYFEAILKELVSMDKWNPKLVYNWMTNTIIPQEGVWKIPPRYMAHLLSMIKE